MISKLRRRHRLLAPWILGSSLLVLGLGLAFRPSSLARTFSTEQVGAIRLPANFKAVMSASGQDGTAGPSAVVLGWKEPGNGFTKGTLWVSVGAEVDVPDLLVYESDEHAVSGSALPPDARLVGALAPAQPLTVARPRRAPYLVLYSLGHKAVWGSLSLAGAELR